MRNGVALRAGPRLPAVAAFAAVAVTAAASGASPSPRSGVRGVVVVGPACPVARVAQACPDRPLAGASIRAGGRRTFSDQNGRFVLRLVPGVYRVEASAQVIGPQERHRLVRVRHGRYSRVRFVFDSGIR